MKRLSQTLAFAALSCLAVEAVAQQGNYVLGLEGWGGYTSNGTVPFWLRSNQFGSVPLDGASLSLIGFARKDFESGKDKLFDWGASFEGRANLGQGSSLTLIEGYGKVRLGIFELRAGRSKKIIGLCDTTLSSGSWSVSGTNLGIPEVELSVRDFWTIPWLGELFAFKGNYSHGWMGTKEMSRYILHDTVSTISFLHQKSLYGRFGKPSWKMKLYGGFNHQVVWGDEQKYYLDDYTLTPVQTYLYVITGKKFTNGYIQEERQGNHLGSIDLGLEYLFEKIKITLYRQSIYEAGGLAHLANIEDGLNGLILENTHHKDGSSGWKKFVLEVLYTKKQSKDSWSPYADQIYFERYYNHGQYIQGWSYIDGALGTPMITTRENIRTELPTAPEEFYINNRVIAFHLGGEGTINGFNYLFKATLSNNYGTYLTADPDGDGSGIEAAGDYGIFRDQKQFSAFLDLGKRLSGTVDAGLILAADIGDLYYNSLGIMARASYTFMLQ